VAYAALALLILLAYANSFRGGFVFDNRVLILEDTRIRALTSTNLDLILNKPYWWPFANTPLYRPATTLSYLMNYAVLGDGDRPAGYHAVNWLIHTLNVWLAFALSLRIGRRFWPAVFIGALWAVHPLGTEAVTNIVGRADLLAAFGVLASLFAHLQARDAQGRRRWSWTALSAAAMTTAVFSKESAVAGIGVIVLCDLLWPDDSTGAERAQRWVILAVPVAVFLYERSSVLGSVPAEVPYVDNPLIRAGFWSARLTALSIMGRYLALVAWPARLSADYSFSQIPFASGNGSEWLAWIAVGALAVVALAGLRRRRAVGFCIGAALIMFLPVANLLFSTGTIMAERLMYLPSVFLLAASVAAIYSLASVVGISPLAPALLALAVVLCGARTVARNLDWRDDLSLWTATSRVAPASFKAHDSLAEALYEADPLHNNLDRVTEEKEKSLGILETLPDRDRPVRPYRAGASYYLEQGDWLHVHRAKAEDVDHAYRRAVILGERYLDLAKAHQVPTKDISDAELLISTAYSHLNQTGKAIESARRAAIGQPFNPAAYRDLSAALLSDHRTDDAAVELMTGFVVTGDQELRNVLIALYQGGLDVSGCATRFAGANTALNPSCEIVRRHLCTAVARAAQLHLDNGHPELAKQVSTFTVGANCAASTQ
jgi:hypothetical protein